MPKQNIEERICNLLHESVQQWDKDGLFRSCSNKTYSLFNVLPERLKKVEDLFSEWEFYDCDNNPVIKEELPPYRVLLKQEACTDCVYKMVSANQMRWVVFSASPLLDDAGGLEGVVTTAVDITDYKVDEQKYKSIANYDPLTKLPNRLLLADRLDLAIMHAERNRTSVAVCLIDFDGFKEVNDVHGHNAGDEVLIEAAKRMQGVVRGDDTIARLGGDEFVVILTNLKKSEECAVTLYRLLNVIASPFSVAADGKSVSISASIGVSIYPDDRVEADTLLRHADMAMYKAKNSGKNRFSFFDITADQKIKANYRTINKLKNSLASGEFCLYYQPKVNTAAGEILEVEALARWNHPLLGVVSPAEFLPLIENDEELCEQFDAWVVNEALAQMLRWQEEGLYLKVCVNISPRQFKSRQFMKWLKGVIRESGVPMELLSYLEFEILETAAVESLNRSNEIIRECKELGISFALDDFGTGYSTLMHLKELHIDTIKIDRIFVSGMLDNSANMVIVQAVIALANAFDITVTAEGAENIEHIISLLEMGCDAIQGYAIARPMPADEVHGFVTEFRPDPRWTMVSHTLPTKADFELLLAMSNHKYWLETVLTAFEAPDFDAEMLTLDYTQCRFGKWFELAKNLKYREVSSFRELDALHQAIHTEVQLLAAGLKREARSILPEERSAIERLSRRMCDALERIRKEVETIRQQNDLVHKILEKRSQYGKRRKNRMG